MRPKKAAGDSNLSQETRRKCLVLLVILRLVLLALALLNGGGGELVQWITCLFHITSQGVVIKMFVYLFVNYLPAPWEQCPCLLPILLRACLFSKSWKHKELQNWMDSDTGGPSLIESLCHFVNKENEDSIVVNILRLHAASDQKRKGENPFCCLSVCDPSPHSHPPPTSCPASTPVLGWAGQSSMG